MPRTWTPPLTHSIALFFVFSRRELVHRLVPQSTGPLSDVMGKEKVPLFRYLPEAAVIQSHSLRVENSVEFVH